MIQIVNYITDNKWAFDIITVNHNLDHLHLLLSSKPNITVSSIVKILKQKTTNFVSNFRRYIKSKYYGNKRLLCPKVIFVQQ